MFLVYYYDQKKNRHEIGNFEEPIPAINAALEAIYDKRWAWKAVVEKDGVVCYKYFN